MKLKKRRKAVDTLIDGGLKGIDREALELLHWHVQAAVAKHFLPGNHSFHFGVGAKGQVIATGSTFEGFKNDKHTP